jgi:dTDP-4-dehydrorhamnose 3,5-epimerase
MEIVKHVFDKALVIKLKSRTDNRGPMTVAYDEGFAESGIGFIPKETRVYTMSKKGTFFGIHYREEKDPMDKLVTVIRGRGMDYIVDLRPDSPTYLKWERVELSAENALSVYVPAGFGHGFQSLEDDTIQLYSVNTYGDNAYSKTVSYRDEKIGLELEVPVTEIADYDIEAPSVSVLES